MFRVLLFLLIMFQFSCEKVEDSSGSGNYQTSEDNRVSDVEVANSAEEIIEAHQFFLVLPNDGYQFQQISGVSNRGLDSGGDAVYHVQVPCSRFTPIDPACSKFVELVVSRKAIEFSEGAFLLTRSPTKPKTRDTLKNRQDSLPAKDFAERNSLSSRYESAKVSEDIVDHYFKDLTEELERHSESTVLFKNLNLDERVESVADLSLNVKPSLNEFSHLNQSRKPYSLTLSSKLKAKFIRVKKALVSSKRGDYLKELQEAGIKKMYLNSFEKLKILVQNDLVKYSDLEQIPLRDFYDQDVLRQDLKDSQLGEQFLATEILGAQATRYFRQLSRQTVVLGKLPETHAKIFQHYESIDTLNIKDWTFNKNMEWLQSHLDRGSLIYLGSRPKTYIKDSTPFTPVYHAELQLLLQNGYVRVGNWMVKTSGELEIKAKETKYVAGVCVHPSCY